MHSSRSLSIQMLWRSGAARLLLISIAFFAVACAGLPGFRGPDTDGAKSVQVRFDTFDVGSDDCEDIFSYGDFNVRMTVTVQPGNVEVFATNRGAALGSAAFQADLQSINLNENAAFDLLPGESFEVEIRITEDDPINSQEPQPWEESESFDYLTVASQSLSLTNGPGCFRDDRFDIVVTVIE